MVHRWRRPDRAGRGALTATGRGTRRASDPSDHRVRNSKPDTEMLRRATTPLPRATATDLLRRPILRARGSILPSRPRRGAPLLSRMPVPRVRAGARRVEVPVGSCRPGAARPLARRCSLRPVFLYAPLILNAALQVGHASLPAKAPARASGRVHPARHPPPALGARHVPATEKTTGPGARARGARPAHRGMRARRLQQQFPRARRASPRASGTADRSCADGPAHRVVRDPSPPQPRHGHDPERRPDREQAEGRAPAEPLRDPRGHPDREHGEQKAHRGL